MIQNPSVLLHRSQQAQGPKRHRWKNSAEGTGLVLGSGVASQRMLDRISGYCRDVQEAEGGEAVGSLPCLVVCWPFQQNGIKGMQKGIKFWERPQLRTYLYIKE